LLDKPLALSGPVPAQYAVGSSCASTVSQPMMAPFGVAQSLNLLLLDTVG